MFHQAVKSGIRKKKDFLLGNLTVEGHQKKYGAMDYLFISMCMGYRDAQF